MDEQKKGDLQVFHSFLIVENKNGQVLSLINEFILWSLSSNR